MAVLIFTGPSFFRARPSPLSTVALAVEGEVSPRRGGGHATNSTTPPPPPPFEDHEIADPRRTISALSLLTGGGLDARL